MACLYLDYDSDSDLVVEISGFDVSVRHYCHVVILLSCWPVFEADELLICLDQDLDRATFYLEDKISSGNIVSFLAVTRIGSTIQKIIDIPLFAVG